MLFQRTNNKIDMAVSATNCFSYRLRVHCVPMFILSNDFFGGIDDEPADRRDYLDTNIEYWRIDSPLFADT